MRLILGFVIGVVVIAAAIMMFSGGETPTDAAKTGMAEPLSPQTAKAPCDSDLEARLAEAKRLSVTELAGQTWQTACLSRGAQPAPKTMTACWPADTDRTLGGSYVNVLKDDGTCGQWRTARPVIDRRFEDSLCLARADVPGLSLRDAGRIVDIE